MDRSKSAAGTSFSLLTSPEQTKPQGTESAQIFPLLLHPSHFSASAWCWVTSRLSRRKPKTQKWGDTHSDQLVRLGQAEPTKWTRWIRRFLLLPAPACCCLIALQQFFPQSFLAPQIVFPPTQEWMNLYKSWKGDAITAKFETGDRKWILYPSTRNLLVLKNNILYNVFTWKHHSWNIAGLLQLIHQKKLYFSNKCVLRQSESKYILSY